MKKKYIQIISVVLLSVIFISFIYFYFSSKEKTNLVLNSNAIIPENSKDKILSDIDSILYSFGIRKDWIKEATFKDKDKINKGNELMISREVRIPSDLAVIDLNYEITNYFRNNNFELKVTEDPKSKNITMNVVSVKDSLRIQSGIIKFVYTDTLKRNAAEVSIVLDSLDLYSLKEVEEILSSTQEYSVILPLRNDKADYQSRIIELNRDYLLKLSVGDEDDIEADFKDGMKENVWRTKIKAVSISFPKTSGVILLSSSRNQDFYQAVKDEFIRNNIKVYPYSVFDEYKSTENKAISLFEDIINESRQGKKFLFYDINFDPKAFESYDRLVYNMKKLGYKFYSFRDLMNRIK